MRLMIVDDSNVMRLRIARAVLNPKLRNLSIVGMARNGLEALELSARQQPDLVTMDLTMPEMDGNACISALLARQPEINILVVSALSDKATAIDALKRGARGFLYKPFTDEQLVKALLEITA